ncbi:hypothetical protein F5J12DRAFT_928399, partial [Pisolithus orientalis]|uniref:uncharacterized protein n=1 Tax=Pisolithus orientalis TaxID=936130 RepID=UPI002224C95B
MSATAEEELQVLHDNLRQIRLVNYILSCAAFLVYDILTNLGREVPLVWRYYCDTTSISLGAAEFVASYFKHIFFLAVTMLFFTLLNNHRGLSVPLYAFTRTNFEVTNHFTRGGRILYTTLVNVIRVIRLNAMYQAMFYGTNGLREHQLVLASGHQILH